MEDDPLQRLIWRETVAEALALLTSEEERVARLRALGLKDRQIAACLGVSRSAVSLRMLQARRRIQRRVPELAAWQRARRRAPSPPGRGAGREETNNHPPPAIRHPPSAGV